MVAETIFVGTELLLGNIVNTNGAYLAQQLALLGVDCFFQTVVGDNEKRLRGCIENALTRSDVVILCGGLGPTQDDITKETAAKVFRKKMFLDETIAEHIREYFARKGKDMTKNNLKQAMIPSGATILQNKNGTAPGILMEKDGKMIVLLPGPPMELKPMFEQEVMPVLQKKSRKRIASVMVKVCGISESALAEQLDALICGSGEVTVAPYAKLSEVHLRVTAIGKSQKAAYEKINLVVKEIRDKLGDSVYAVDDCSKGEDTSLEEAVASLLLEKKMTISTVESCTGGLLAGRITNVAGVSEIFKDGYVTYSNRAKKKVIGVSKKTLQNYGAVSRETVEEMLLSSATYHKTDVVAATSGIAGPGGGSKEKPVGLVYIGCKVGNATVVKECFFSGNRQKIRESAVTETLILIRSCLLSEKDGKEN